MGTNLTVSFHLPSRSAFHCENNDNIFLWNKWEEIILTHTISFIKLLASFPFIKAHVLKTEESSTVHLEISLKLQ